MHRSCYCRRVTYIGADYNVERLLYGSKVNMGCKSWENVVKSLSATFEYSSDCSTGAQENSEIR